MLRTRVSLVASLLVVSIRKLEVKAADYYYSRNLNQVLQNTWSKFSLIMPA